MTREEYWFWLCSAKGIYNRSIKMLLSVYPDPEEIYKEEQRRIEASGLISKAQAASLFEEKRSGDFLRRLDKMKKSGIRFIWLTSDEFPDRLKNIPTRPFCLYVKGSLPDPNLASCAVVGARACSDYGRKMAVEFASALSGAGIQIISGMASGIDSISQKAAMDAKGMTWAVLGGGPDVIYPAENTQLYYRILEEGGGIISEYPPGTAPNAWQFPHRNRLISGLSDKLLIIEARKKSGTLSTARHALDQGRDIYALPGRITDPLSEGCNELIYDGAQVLLKPEYIIHDLFLRSGAGNCAAVEKTSSGSADPVLSVMSYHAMSADEIALRLGKDIESVTVSLSSLELDGYVKEVGTDHYVRI